MTGVIWVGGEKPDPVHVVKSVVGKVICVVVFDCDLFIEDARKKEEELGQFCALL